MSDDLDWELDDEALEAAEASNATRLDNEPTFEAVNECEGGACTI